MNISRGLDWIRQFQKFRFLFLLVTLLLYIGMLPVLGRITHIAVQDLVGVAFTAIFLSAVYAVSLNRRQAVATSLIALPTLVLIWVTEYITTPSIITARLILTILFLTFAIVRIMGAIYRAPRVSQEVISAAIVVYLIIGIDWSVAYQLLEHLLPGSLNNIQGPLAEQKYRFVYFSFVTLTTLGYGDMTPLTDIAGSLSIMEAIIGQLYITVLIARLVGMQVAGTKNSSGSADG